MTELPKWIRGLGNTADGVFIVDRGQRVVFWNRAAEQLLGYAESEVLGRPCYDVIAGRTPTGKVWCRADCQVQRSVIKDEPHASFRLDVRDKGGQERRASVSIIGLAKRKSPLTVHLIRDAKSQSRDERTIGEILSILRTEGYREHGSEPAPQPADAAGRPDDRVASLSSREVEILSLVAQGLSAAAIAERLNLSAYTVRNHIQNALQKLGLHTKAQAVAYAYKNGLI